MLCFNCSKLAIFYCNKKCAKCKGEITQTISNICESCSNQNKQCSSCLKKIISKPPSRGGCGSCRK